MFFPFLECRGAVAVSGQKEIADGLSESLRRVDDLSGDVGGGIGNSGS